MARGHNQRAIWSDRLYQRIRIRKHYFDGETPPECLDGSICDVDMQEARKDGLDQVDADEDEGVRIIHDDGYARVYAYSHFVEPGEEVRSIDDATWRCTYQMLGGGSGKADVVEKYETRHFLGGCQAGRKLWQSNGLAGLLKKRVSVWWAGEHEWFSGSITKTDGSDMVTVKFNDGDIQSYDLNSEAWRLEDTDPTPENARAACPRMLLSSKDAVLEADGPRMRFLKNTQAEGFAQPDVSIQLSKHSVAIITESKRPGQEGSVRQEHFVVSCKKLLDATAELTADGILSVEIVAESDVLES